MRHFSLTLLLIFLLSCQTEGPTSDYILCTTPEASFVILDDKTMSELAQIADSARSLCLCFEMKSLNLYFCSQGSVVRYGRIDNGCGTERFYSTGRLLAKKGQKVNVYEISCSNKMYKNLTSNPERTDGHYLDIRPERNLKRITLWLHAPDTLHLGRIEEKTGKNVNAQLLRLECFYVPPKAERLIAMLRFRFPLCYRADYHPFGRTHYTSGDIGFDNSRIECLFPAGFPCEQIETPDIIQHIDSVVCSMNDTLRIAYICREDSGKVSKILRDENGFYGMRRTW